MVLDENDEHHLPIDDSIDLHAFAPRDIPSVVEEYVLAAHEAGLREVRLIHLGGHPKPAINGQLKTGHFE